MSDYVTFSNESVQKMIRIWTLENERNENYDYDRNSNRKIITENEKNRSYTYYKNDKNGNTARVMSDGKWYYTYDDNGNRTAKGYKQNSDNDKVVIDETRENWKYTWDYHNRLVKVQQFNAPDNAQNVKVEYTYDVMNRRIERASYTSGTSVKTQYAYGRNGAMTYQKKTAGTSVTSRTFIYLNNQMVGFMDKTEDGIETIRYTVTDIQGSVIEVYDEDNNLLWKSNYTAFGIKAGETIKLLDFDGLYTGCDYDAETGLTYHWNRWRSEDGDSWLTQDPVRDGINWYGYAGQNPINYTDINGLTTQDDFYFQKVTNAETLEEKNAYIQQQTQSWEANMGYSEYTDGTPNQSLIDPGHSASEQYDFLKQYYSRYKDAKGKVKGLAAKNLRAQIRNAKRFDLKGLFSIDESFMNNELRDFLNLNENGTLEYTIEELREEGSGWKELSSWGSMYHQTNAGDSDYLNAKFVHEDGREVVITRDKTVITSGVDKGTFNYGKPSIAPGSAHKLYDINPYEKQYKNQYVLTWDHHLLSFYYGNSHYWY